MAKDAVDVVLKNAGIEKKFIRTTIVSPTFRGVVSNRHSIGGEVAPVSLGIDAIVAGRLRNYGQSIHGGFCEWD